ncbi:MAG TPA: class I SAM-dependent methyltransferase [Ktedonobacteraceae bacterium]
MHKNLHEDNRLSWNAATVAHNSHKGDQAAFFRNGGNNLYPEEKALLGDIRGLSVIHLQCNSGQNTLSMAQMGATVTGVDISDVAIDFARQLSRDSGVPATFYRMDVYDWLEETARSTQRFDVAFSSYGAIVWLSDLELWAKGIAAILKPGGRFVTVDYHPVMHIFDEQMQRKFSYFNNGKWDTFFPGVGDYVAFARDTLDGKTYVEGVQDFQNPHPSHEFIWGIGEIVSALLKAGLLLTSLQEYPYANGSKFYDDMHNDQQRWFLPEGQPSIPMMYSITAQKPH